MDATGADRTLIPHTEYLSVLSFENRSAQDKKAALARISDGKAFDAPADETSQVAFEKDVRLITHSPAFRRLGRQSMLAPSYSHAFQSRLSHSLTVADTGVAIAGELHLGAASKELIRAIAYAHDIGHPPFSHEGEAAINQRLKPYGIVWDHDKTALNILQRISPYGLDYDGLPLTYACVEGITLRHHIGEDGKRNTIEGQIAAVSDWIAATVTDIQDMMTFKGVSVKPEEDTKKFFDTLSKEFPIAKDIADELKAELAVLAKATNTEQRKQWKSDRDRRIPAMVQLFCDKLRDRLIADVIANGDARIHNYAERIQYAEDVRALPELVVTPSPAMIQQLNNLKRFYAREVYPEIAQKHLDTVRLVGMVFDDFAGGAVPMLDGWNVAFQRIKSSGMTAQEKKMNTALLVTDYMTANMTDKDVILHLKRHHTKEANKILSASCQAPHSVMPYPENTGRAK